MGTDEGAVRPGGAPRPGASKPGPRPPPPGIPLPRKSAPIDERALSAFTGPIPPRPLPPLYILGLAATAFMMLLLPLVYFTLVAGAAWLVYWHATENTTILSHRVGGSRGAFLMYFGPLIAGIAVVIFLVKPLFARQPPPPVGRRLAPPAEPLFFRFVEKLCVVVGAPVPAFIEITGEPNAAAGYHGGFGGVVRGELQLLVGLPLVRGFNASQLAGVLAHELGHFSQRGAMVLTWVIASVNNWFARVVYERDGLDDQLDEWTRDGGCYGGLIAGVAKISVGLGRFVLKGLMHAARAVSAFMARQMEYDADRCECLVAGSDTFVATVLRLEELIVADKFARDAVQEAWSTEKRLVDDLPALVVQRADSMPMELRKTVHEKLQGVRVGWFEDHPSDGDRIAAAKAIGAPGVFRLDVPATALFREPDTLSCDITRDLYHDVFSGRIPDARIVPVSEFLGREQSAGAAQDCLSRYLQGADTFLRPIPVREVMILAEGPCAVTAPALTAARDRMIAALPQWKAAMKEFQAADRAIVAGARSAAVLPASFGEGSPLAGVRAKLTGERDLGKAALQRQKAIEPALKPFEEAAADRLHAALLVLQDPDAAARVPGGPAFAARIPALAEGARVLARIQPDLIEIRNHRAGIDALVEAASGSNGGVSIDRPLNSELAAIRKKLFDLSKALQSEPNPFAGEGQRETIAGFAIPRVPGVGEAVEVLAAAEAAMDRLGGLWQRALAELAVAAEAVELAYGLKPLAAPMKEM